MDKILPWILLFVSITKVFVYFPTVPDFIYYGSFLASFIWLVMRGGLIVSGYWLPFLLAILVSVWVNDIPAFFKTTFRVIAFFAIVFTVGPFFDNTRLSVLRRVLFIHSLTAIRWIVLLSLLAWIIGLNIVMGYSGFCGLTNHSMLIGPVASLSLLYALYRFHLEKSGSGRRSVEAVVCLCSLFVILLAGSRSALGASLLSLVFFYSRMYRRRAMQILKVFMVCVTLAVLTFKIWEPYTERLRSKMEYGKASGSITYTRDILWQDRLREFNAYPIFGVGFASYNLEYARSGTGLNRISGTVEPGSAWLFLLSSMGIVGFFSLLLPVGYYMWILYKEDSTGMNGGVLSAMLFLLTVHMFFEGYVTASGSYLCFFLWLLLSECRQTVRKRHV